MKLNYTTLALTLAAIVGAVVCVALDRSQAGAVVGLLGTVATALAPQLLSAQPPEAP